MSSSGRPELALPRRWRGYSRRAGGILKRKSNSLLCLWQSRLGSRQSVRHEGVDVVYRSEQPQRDCLRSLPAFSHVDGDALILG